MRRFFERLEDRRLLAAIMGVVGNGVNIADGDTTPVITDFTDYGPAGISNIALTRSYTIKNTGDTALGFSAVQIGGTNASEFSILTAPAASVAAGGSTTLVVKFDPSAAGVRTATITIPRADQPGNPYNFSIQGQALNATVQANGLQTATTVAGTGRAAVSGDTLRVNYTGYLLNGFKFDSSLNPGRSPFEFTIDQSNVIQGWHQGMKGMKVGEKRVLIIPPALGYGGTANGDIPADSTLIFEVDLLEFLAPDMKIRGRGQLISDGDASPAATDATHFGSIPVGAKQTHTFTITNDGNAGLSLSGTPAVQLLGVSGSDFTVSELTFGNNAATFTVTFQPTSIGTSSATVSIPTNDPNKNPYDFVVRGVGRDPAISSVGVMRGDGSFLIDQDANRIQDGNDPIRNFGAAGDKPVAGDWTGTGVRRLGVFRGTQFLLDINGNGTFDAGDATYTFGLAGDTPTVGDWNGDGTTDIGVWCAGVFYLDSNGNHAWELGTDAKFNYGTTGDSVVVGDWNGDGVDDVGVFHITTGTGVWTLDADGSRSTGDASFNFGASGDVPIAGDFAGSGKSQIGLYRSGQFILDLNNDHNFTAGTDTSFNFGAAGNLPITGMWTKRLPQSVGVYRNGVFYRDTDRTHSFVNGVDASSNFGQAGDKPITGDWNGKGKRNIGVFRNGQFFLDTNGNGAFDAGDTTINFGQAGDRPVAGDWDGDHITDVGVFRNGTFLLRTDDGTVTIPTGVQGQPLAGDWNGDGKDDLGIRVGKTFFLDANGNRQWDGPAGGDKQINFGLATDKAIIGDWNGDGVADVGVFRNGTFIIDSNGDRIETVADMIFAMGQAGDLPIA